MRRRDHALPDPEVVRGLRELDAALAGERTADPDLALLVADVRAARPEPDAAFLAKLDARVHDGFPLAKVKEPRRARLRLPTLFAPGLGFAVVVALAVLVATLGHGSGGGGDSASSSSSSSGSTSSGLAKELDAAPTPQAAPSAGEASSDSSSSSSASSSSSSSAAAPKASPAITSAPAAPDRKVQRAAELTLTPKPGDVQDTADGVVRETQAAGGYVQQSDIATRDSGGEASFTLRIPSARLDETLARLSKLAHVGALSQSASDITSAFDSASAQLSDARAERAALLRALGKATTDRQIASLRARLADNRSEIAQRKGALDAQRRRADLATVAVTVEGRRAAAKKDDGGGAWTPRDALHDAGRILEVAGGVALIALAVLAPLAILAALALLAGHTLRRRRREGALDGAA
ncbi:MAG: hypothetical protein JWQ18_2424 [Conexibacter sp.]|nr:hypothetical protein [Conexibacter sp.]